MTLLDANALLALLWSEPAESEVATLLRSGECATPASCLSEVVDQLIRCAGVPAEDVVDSLEPLIEASLMILPVENRLAWRAGELRAAHYARGSTDLSLADCTLLAATGPDDRLATSDAALARTAQVLDITVIPLPNSQGRRPAPE